MKGGVPGRREPDTEPSGIVGGCGKPLRFVAVVPRRVGAVPGSVGSVGSVVFFDAYFDLNTSETQKKICVQYVPYFVLSSYMVGEECAQLCDHDHGLPRMFWLM